MTADRLAAIADELYAVGFADFVSARRALVKECRLRGDRTLADQVNGLRKPGLAAWAVNQLVRAEAGQIARIIEVGDGLQDAQDRMDGKRLRELTRQRRQLTAAATARARVVAAGRGVTLSAAAVEQVEATLTAALLDRRALTAVRSGTLVDSLSPGRAAESDSRESVAVPTAAGFVEPDVVEPAPIDRRAALDEAVDAARRALAAAEGTTSATSAETQQVRARLLRVRAQITEARLRLAELEHAEESLDSDLRTAEERERAARSSEVAAGETLGALTHERDELGRSS
ncbi:MAG: hypothetical protein ACRCYQ_15950 [Nocardioides sp.]